ncbi:unnamed protein product [Caenorhabditis bovis]|uniref:Uncharacterized protein n=1 Tax=Caenorhabditis bovis TaxID=2654633 RepID=A0A8S1EHS5_9PELO|nr:unnamed protein product [Caenorhabditis bovis]
MTMIFSKMSGNSPQSNGTALGVRIIGGSFLCLSIVSSVIACALWDPDQRTPAQNYSYYCGLVATVLLNISIVYLMNRGITLQKAHYLQPFIVCALLHLIVCILLSAIFFLYVVTRATFYSPWSDLGFFAIFVILTGFWIIAISLAREYRDYIIYDDFLHENLPSYV